MQQADYDPFVEMLNAVATLLRKPPRPLSEIEISLWWSSLREYDLAAVRQGFSLHVKNPDTGKWMPAPADIIFMLGGSTQDSALLAWAKVDKAVRQVGSHQSVVFDDPIVHRVLLDMGGWAALGNKAEKEWPFLAKEFETRYRAFKLRNVVPEYPPILIGISQAGNVIEGYAGGAPVLIGDASQAGKVMLGGTTTPILAFTRTTAADLIALEAPRRAAA